jgi:hypothetical protein
MAAPFFFAVTRAAGALVRLVRVTASRDFLPPFDKGVLLVAQRSRGRYAASRTGAVLRQDGVSLGEYNDIARLQSIAGRERNP